MSKGLGQKIAIQFTEKLVGDVSGKNPPFMRGENFFRATGTATASSQYSSYSPDRAFDGDTSSYWYTRSSGIQWIQIQFSEKIYASGFRWYVASYPPYSFNTYGSDDGEAWSLLVSANSPSSPGWYTFDFPVGSYLYYRWEITSRHSSYLRIQDIELREAAGNEAAFTVTGQEYKYINGPIIEKTYQVVSVERHPDYTDDKHVLLTMHPQGRFNNVVGNLTVSYDHTIGKMQGRGGFVESFSATFEPSELVTFPQPNADQGIIAVAIQASVSFVHIDYYSRYGDSTVVVLITCSISFLHVDDVNP